MSHIKPPSFFENDDGTFHDINNHLCDKNGNPIFDPECAICSAGDLMVWLDDERSLPSGFDVIVSTADAAIELLKTGKVGLLSMDHDLGSDCKTGQKVADFIERSAYDGSLKELKLQVHTQNPVGRVKMSQALQNAQKYWEDRRL